MGCVCVSILVAVEGKVKFGGRGVVESAEMESRASRWKERVERLIESRAADLRIRVVRREEEVSLGGWDMVGIVRIEMNART